jgi:Tol biopolymer transport system component
LTLAPGFRLGPYEILAPLGAGGMGEVYRAKDPRLGRDVAIKVLPASLSEDADRLRRFEKEARSASSLNHPNIVTVYEIASSDSTSYIAMELVSGMTLRQMLSDGPLPTKKLLRVATQIAEGLARAHEAGIVHRDLKPENVMVAPDGLVKILDFGLAKLTRPEGQGGGTHAPTVSGGTAPGIVMGTVAYMSPEQARGKPFDFRSDQFALGSVLYEMATGKSAFARESGPETMAAVIRDEPEPLGTIAPKTPAPLRWMIERCLGKEPHERYGSTSDLARDLATLRDHLTEATSSSAMAGLEAPHSRPGARAGYLLAALGVLAAAGVAYWVGIRRAEHPAPSYRRLTFRRGTVFTARFAPDGQTVVYSGAWEGQPARIFAMRAGGTESRSLQLPDARVLAISATGELAISIGRESVWESTGTLARVPLEGGAPREVLENVSMADWTPDGRDLAVVHEVGGTYRVEFPIGKVLYETTDVVESVRFSPKGDRLAVSTGRTIVLVDLSGKAKSLLKDWGYIGNVAWRPDGGEIWFGGQRRGGKFAVYAVTPSGRERTVREEAGGLYFHDIARDGRVLLNDYFWHSSLAALPAGENAERELSWMDRPNVDAISNDGRTVVFDEWGEGGGETGSIYLRTADGSAAVRLGEGYGLDLSPDGRWLLAHPAPSSETHVLLPTGPGQPRRLEHKGITSVLSGRLLPDGKRVLFLGRVGTGALRVYVQNLDGGAPRAISSEGMTLGALAVSPDGRSFAAIGPDSKIAVYPVGGGAPRPLPGAEALDNPVLWSADGGSLYVYRSREAPARVFKVDVATGRRAWSPSTTS